MKRPADAGRGLDGVARKVERLLQPRHRDPGGGDDRRRAEPLDPPVRRHHRRRHGAASFTLPIAHSKVAEGAAAQLANKMGMDPALVVHAKPMGPDFTFFVVYGRVNHLVDPSTVEVVERDYPLLTPKEVNAAVKRSLRRRLVVVGACIGTDAHTVGIDAILNIKGFAGEKGLEYYRELKVVNLGAQVSVPAARRAGPRRRRPTPCWSPRSSPSATPTCSTPGRCRRPSASPTPPTSGRCWSSAVRASTRRWPTSSASTGSSPAAPRRARSPPTSSTGSPSKGGRPA